MAVGLTPASQGLTVAAGLPEVTAANAPPEPMVKPNTQPGLAVLVVVPPGLYADWS